MRYYLNYVLRLGIADTKYYFTRGEIFHDVLEKVLLNPEDPIEKYMDLIDFKFNEAKEKGLEVEGWGNTKSKVISDTKRGVKLLSESLLKKPGFTLMKYQHGNVEKSTTELDSVVPIVNFRSLKPDPINADLRFIIDLVSYDDVDGLVISDHKMGSTKYSDIYLTLDFQLPVYAYCFWYLHQMECFPELKGQKISKFKVRLNTVKLEKGSVYVKFHEKDYTLKQIELKIETIKKAIANIRTMQPVETYGSDCAAFCGMLEPCTRLSRGQGIDDFIAARNEREKQASLLGNITDLLSDGDLL